jgi:hypothetical protein
MLAKRSVLLLLLLVGCHRDAPPAKAPQVAAEVRPGSVLVIENRGAISRLLEGERIPFDDVWTPSASAANFLDTAVLRYVDADPGEWRGVNAELSIDRERLGSYVRECAGFVVAGRRRMICQFLLEARWIRRGVMNEDRTFTLVMDGGCAVFLVVADIERREILSLGCNGVA